MAHAILLHEPTDDVGVAVRDLKVGEEVGAVTLDGELVGAVKLVNDVPLGHKVAMREMAAGQEGHRIWAAHRQGASQADRQGRARPHAQSEDAEVGAMTPANMLRSNPKHEADRLPPARRPLRHPQPRHHPARG